jgi:monofunctional biosynthetic peptidoglycan transglycosylase
MARQIATFRPIRALLRWTFRLFLVLGLLFAGLLVLWRFAHPVSTLMLVRYATGEPVDRQFKPLRDISPALQAAVVGSEDGQFCRHHGVDWGALREVLSDEDGPTRGASTIPMQVIKNLFLWPSRSTVRKGLEIPMALVLDFVWTKQHVLQTYLNIAEWGDGVFGAEAAAQHYFRKSAAALTASEAALLATSLPNPKLRNAARPSPSQRRLASHVQHRMARMGPYLDCLRTSR